MALGQIVMQRETGSDKGMGVVQAQSYSASPRLPVKFPRWKGLCLATEAPWAHGTSHAGQAPR